MIKPKPLPLKTFLETFKYAPRLAISLVVVNKKGEFILARRAIPPKPGTWHLPGGFVLKGEPLAQCTKRICEKELGLHIDPKSAELMGVFDDLDKDPRGHVVDIIYRIKISTLPTTTAETKEVDFFKKIPRSIGFNHGDTLGAVGYKY